MTEDEEQEHLLLWNKRDADYHIPRNGSINESTLVFPGPLVLVYFLGTPYMTCTNQSPHLGRGSTGL